MAQVETARSRRAMVHQAGWRPTSFISILAGTLVAFGAIAVIAAAAGAGGSALGVDTDGLSTDEWRRAGIAGGAVGAIVLLVSYFFGGYVAGRMSRRAGARHGLLVFVLSVLLVGVVALVGWAAADTGTSAIEDAAQDQGVPTDADTWSDIGLGAGIAALLAMAIGAVAGGIQGDRWHGRLATAVEEQRRAVLTGEDDVDLDDEREPFDRTRSIDLRGDDDQADHHPEPQAGDRDADGRPSVEEERDLQRYRAF